MSDTGTTYKLNRFFHIIFNSTMWWQLILFGIIEVAFLLFSRYSVAVRIAFVVIINCLVMSNMFFHSPKSFTLNGDLIEFNEYIRISSRKDGVAGTRFIVDWLWVTCSVSNVRDVEFHQTLIEKIFDIGHISFSGQAVYTAKKHTDKIDPKYSFKIYGIKHFSCFKTQFGL